MRTPRCALRIGSTRPGGGGGTHGVTVIGRGLWSVGYDHLPHIVRQGMWAWLLTSTEKFPWLSLSEKAAVASSRGRVVSLDCRKRARNWTKIDRLHHTTTPQHSTHLIPHTLPRYTPPHHTTHTHTTLPVGSKESAGRDH